MIARQIGVVLCRVGAAVLTVQAVRSMGYTAPALVYSEGLFWPNILVFSLLTALPGLSAIGLWIYADRISGIVDSVESSATPEPLTGVDLVRIGTALIGMYLAATAVINGVYVEIENLARPDLGAGRQALMDQSAARILGLRVSNVLQLAIGLALLIGRNRISVALGNARIAGVNKE